MVVSADPTASEAIAAGNLKLLCSRCNQRKGAKL